MIAWVADDEDIGGRSGTAEWHCGVTSPFTPRALLDLGCQRLLEKPY